MLVLGLAHASVGRVARLSAFEVMLWVMMDDVGIELAPHDRDSEIS